MINQFITMLDEHVMLFLLLLYKNILSSIDAGKSTNDSVNLALSLSIFARKLSVLGAMPPINS